MASNFTVELQVENLDQVKADLPLLKGLWRIRTADELRKWGRELTDIAFRKSPSDKLRGTDWRRRPESESFKHKWAWQLSRQGADPGLDVGNTDERMQWIVFPTRGNSNVRPKAPGYQLKYFYPGAGPFYAWAINRKPLPGQPVHMWTIEEFNVDDHVSRLANRLVDRSI